MLGKLRGQLGRHHGEEVIDEGDVQKVAPEIVCKHYLTSDFYIEMMVSHSSLKQSSDTFLFSVKSWSILQGLAYDLQLCELFMPLIIEQVVLVNQTLILKT